VCARRLGDRTGHGARTAGSRRLGTGERPGRRCRGRGGAWRSRGRGGRGSTRRLRLRLRPRGWRSRTHGAGWAGSARRGRSGRRRSGGTCLGCIEGTTKPPGHWGLDRAGCGFDELAHLFELGENGLAVDPELLCELVYAGLAWHCTPHFEVVRAHPQRPHSCTRSLVISGTSSCAHLGRPTLLGRDVASEPRHRWFRTARRPYGCARPATRCQQHRRVAARARRPDAAPPARSKPDQDADVLPDPAVGGPDRAGAGDHPRDRPRRTESTQRPAL
jgi:hypothetical protein